MQKTETVGGFSRHFWIAIGAIVAVLIMGCAGIFSGEAIVDVLSHTVDGRRKLSRSWLATQPIDLRDQERLHIISSSEYVAPRLHRVVGQKVPEAELRLANVAFTRVTSEEARALVEEPVESRDGESLFLIRAVEWKNNLSVRQFRNGDLTVTTWGYDCFSWNPLPRPSPLVVSLPAEPVGVFVATSLECL